jgi:hypothetical protein
MFRRLSRRPHQGLYLGLHIKSICFVVGLNNISDRCTHSPHNVYVIYCSKKHTGFMWRPRCYPWWWRRDRRRNMSGIAVLWKSVIYIKVHLLVSGIIKKMHGENNVKLRLRFFCKGLMSAEHTTCFDPRTIIKCAIQDSVQRRICNLLSCHK